MCGYDNKRQKKAPCGALFLMRRNRKLSRAFCAVCKRCLQLCMKGLISLFQSRPVSAAVPFSGFFQQTSLYCFTVSLPRREAGRVFYSLPAAGYSLGEVP